MALQKQPVNIPFVQGVETKTDPFQIPIGKFLTLQNIVFTNPGKIAKRNGYTSISKTVFNQSAISATLAFSQLPSSIAAGVHLTTFNNEMVMLDGYNMYSYESASSAWAWKGRATSTKVTTQSISKNIQNQFNPDGCLPPPTAGVAASSGFRLYAWYDAVLGVSFSVVDIASGQIVSSSSIINAMMPRCVYLGSTPILIYYDGTSALKGVIFTNGVGAAPVTIFSDINTGLPIYDAEIINSALYITYYTTAPAVKVALMSAALATTTSMTKSETASRAITLWGDSSNNVYVGYASPTSVKVFVVDSTVVTTVLAPTTVDSSATGIGIYNMTGCYSTALVKSVIFYDQYQGSQVKGAAVNWSSLYHTGDSTQSTVFVQPAVGGSITAQTTAGVSGVPFGGSKVGDIIFINDSANHGGYYKLLTITLPTTGVWTVTLMNIGGVGSSPAGTNIVGTLSGSDYFLLGVYQTYGTAYAINYKTLTVAGVVAPVAASTAPQLIYGPGLGSKAYSDNSNIPTVLAAYQSPLQSTYFLINLYNAITGSAGSIVIGNIAAKISEDTGGGIPGPHPADLTSSMLPRVNLVATNLYEIPILQTDLLFVGNVATDSPNLTPTYTQNGTSYAQITYSGATQSSTLGQNLHVGSGDILMYDGASVVEHGYHIYPEGMLVLSVTASSAQPGVGTTENGPNAGGITNASYYGYVCVYEWRDNQGQVHQSAPSPIVNAVVPKVTGGNYYIVVLDFPYLGVTDKTNVNIVFYRTIANGTIFYRLDPPTTPKANLTNAGFGAYTDQHSDDDITGNQQLYTTGEVENIEAPSSNIMSFYKNRLLVVPSDNPYQYWYSKQVIPGSPVEFSDFFVQNVGTQNGQIVAIATLDDKNIIFNEKSISYVVGQGPSASGENNDFADPYLIATDVGAVDVNSVVKMPLGLMFKSKKGIYLLDRSLGVNYIGSPVEAYNSYDLISGRLMSSVNQVRFLISNGTALVYDYFVSQWSVFTNHSGVSSSIWNNNYIYLNSAGQVFQEAVGVYTEGGSNISMAFQTGWINVAGLQGFERAYYFYLLGSYISSHTLSVSIYFDYSSSASQTVTITPDSSMSLEQWRIFLSTQKCQAFQIAITENAGTGAGLSMSGLNLEVGIKKGYTTIPSAQSTG